MKRIPALLSKTKLMRGYRCQKCIYLTIHHPELEAPITPETQALFDQGNRIGELARNYLPGGTLVDHKPWDFTGALAKTRELLQAETEVIYEAAFEYAGCYARADIIKRNPLTERFQIYEVKSSTKVKPEQIDDVGLQVWIMAKSGLPIESIHIMHLNTDCCYPDLSNLFKTIDVTADIREKYLKIQPNILDIMTTINQPHVPDIDIGAHCLSPTECGFVKHCWSEKHIPKMSVLNLPGLRDKKWDLYHEGILSLDDERLTDLNALQERIIQCYKTEKRYINRDAIRAALNEWVFPLIFLDFETINPAVPRYDGTHPFEQVPFQFSVHVWEHLDAPITHTDFLYETTADPRPTLIPALLKACQTAGSIVAYFGKFESERIFALARYSPADSEALLKLTERIVDPLPIIREHIYDNAFLGSFSLKKVAPALLGASYRYDEMSIADGGAAQRAFEELISPKTPATKKAALKSAMLEYCQKDTLVMVELVKWLMLHNQDDEHASISTENTR